jgi:hypothetical protein
VRIISKTECETDACGLIDTLPSTVFRCSIWLGHTFTRTVKDTDYANAESGVASGGKELAQDPEKVRSNIALGQK